MVSRRIIPLQTARSLLFGAIVCCLALVHGYAAEVNRYGGMFGDASADFELAWLANKEVKGSMGLPDGSTFQLSGSNYAEGRVRLGLFGNGQQIGVLELSKQVSGKVISWDGKALFNNGQTYAVRFSRAEQRSVAPLVTESGPVLLKQPDLAKVSLNPLVVDGARPEIASFTGACAALVDEAADFVIFADPAGKIERYSISTGHKMWSAQLPGGVGVDGLYLGATDSGRLFVVSASANEVVHQTSIWSLPLNGIGSAEESLKLWEGGSESSDVGAGATVAGHYPNSDDFLINYQASDQFAADDPVPTAIQQIYGRMLNGQRYQVVFNAKSNTLRRPDDKPASDVETPEVGAVFNASRSTSSNLAVEIGESGEVVLLQRGKSGKEVIRKWSPIATSVERLEAGGALIKSSGTQIEFVDTENLAGVLTQQSSAWRTESSAATQNGTDENSTFSLQNSNVRLELEAGYAGGELKLTDVKTGVPIACEGASDLLDVTYGTNPRACWLDGGKALVGFSSGYYLLESLGAKWCLKKLQHDALPIAQHVLAPGKDGKVQISSQDGVYFARVSDKDVRMEKALFLGPRRTAFILFHDYYYAGSTTFLRRLCFADEQTTYPFEQFDLRLNRPDIVLERVGAPDEAVAIAKQMRDKRLKRMGVTEDMLKPDFHVPELEIVGDVPATTNANEINASIKASDGKYPLERLRVFVNNVPVNGRDGESLRDQNTQTLECTIPFKLAVGRNKIQVSVLNSAGAESLYANAEVNCTAKRPEPTLYAVALGVSDYANPDWNLKYAAKDARDVLERLKTRSGGSYGEVKELLLTDKQVTKDSLAQIKDFLKDATIDDTVLVFVAGHGLLDSKYDYYFGTTDIDFNNPAEKGIAFEEFDDLLAGLPCLKKSLLIDTCHAGELDEEEKTLLASADGAAAPLPTGNGIAMRSIGARGMNVKAIEGARGASEWYDRLQGLFVDLRRGSGSTILSSSAGAEYALESSEQQNGLFTYAVLEALDGKKEADTNKDGSVQMSELGEYVKKRVSELTNNKQTPNTRRVNIEGDFSLAKTRT